MNAPLPSAEHARSLRAIDAHFAGRVSPVAETAMRAHLPTCAVCTDRYERQLTLARLDPKAPPPEERIARGLGLGPRRVRVPWTFALLIPAAAAVALAAWPRQGDGGAFVARGGTPAPAALGAFWTYRVGADQAPHLAEQAIAARDELAFAYSNPAGKRYLRVFGIDEHRHVYWFHPSWPANWPAGRPAPRSVPAAAGPGPHELPEAIRHELDGRRLTITTLLSDRPLDVVGVEAALRATRAPDALPALGEGVVGLRRTFEVRR
jgi:hypothetical protein